MISARTAQVLARCNGFRVTVRDELVGFVATPVFSGQDVLPEYLLVRMEGDEFPGFFRAITPDLIATADAGSETVVLEIDRAELASLPEPDVLHRAFPAAAALLPPSPGPPPPRPSPQPPLPRDRHDVDAAPRARAEDDSTLHDYRVLVRHRIATPLTVIRGCAATLRDFPTSSREEVLQLVAAIEGATRELERVALDFQVLDVEHETGHR